MAGERDNREIGLASAYRHVAISVDLRPPPVAGFKGDVMPRNNDPSPLAMAAIILAGIVALVLGMVF